MPKASGTGIFTRLLLNRGYEIVAAEPSSGMRKAFSSRTPEIPVVEADAYHLPFDDGAFDAVTIAQAFHWFADEEALKEIARVLKPKGRVAMIWNLEKVGVSDFMDEHFKEVVAYDAGLPQYRRNDWIPVFQQTQSFKTPYEEFLEDYNLTYTEEELWSRAQSKSFITALDEKEQAGLKKRLSALFKKYPDTSKDANGKIICPQFVRVVALEKS